MLRGNLEKIYFRQLYISTMWRAPVCIVDKDFNWFNSFPCCQFVCKKSWTTSQGELVVLRHGRKSKAVTVKHRWHSMRSYTRCSKSWQHFYLFFPTIFVIFHSFNSFNKLFHKQSSSFFSINQTNNFIIKFNIQLKS